MPRPGNTPRVSPKPLETLQFSLRRFLSSEDEVRAEFPWAHRYVMGLPLPPWQRDLKWSAEQSQRFVTSAWTGVHLGMYLVTEPEFEPGNDVLYKPFANCVMDGQQRLHALELYFTDKLAVPDATGRPALWSQLESSDQRWFSRRIFDCGITPLGSEQCLRSLYDLHNFAGTPHQESERALPRLRPGR